MNTKPIIGIAPNYSYEKKEYTLSEDYVLAIEKAGGCPIVLLPHQALPLFLDGLLLTGGGDIDPLLFGEEPLCQSGEINPLRDACEMRICETALEKDLPMLGICRGMPGHEYRQGRRHLSGYRRAGRHNPQAYPAGTPFLWHTQHFCRGQHPFNRPLGK